MAFITSAVTPVRAAHLRAARVCSISGARVAAVSARSVRTNAPSTRSTVRMENVYPASDVLGLGKDVPSSIYLFSSVIALLLGSYCVYMSNILQPLTANSINPQFVVGSLLVPISWGLHVAAFIQTKNDK